MTPTEEGFYWATSIRRRQGTSPDDFGQRGGVRSVVRLFAYDGESTMQVQKFGSRMLRGVRDFKDWVGPLVDPRDL